MARPRPCGFGGLAAAALATLAIAAVPAPADAQAQTAQSRICRQTLPSDFHRIVNARGQEIFYFRDPVRFLCTGDVVLESDSAVVNRASSAVELVGSVLYRDSTRELRSQWANYLGRMDQLLARDSVVLRDLEGGAVIRGQQLNYLRETDDRPLSRMIITGHRPSAVIPRRPDTATTVDAAEPIADTSDAPMRVWADRMEVEGSNIFRAQGDVDLERGDMTGVGESAVYDQAAERMTLTGSAAIWNESYRLAGERIDAFLEGEGLREVRSEESVRLTSEELNIFADQLRMAFVAGELERLEAWNPTAGEDGPRARAEARDFRLRADSIDAWADSVGIRELRAVGRAYGERDVTDDLAMTTALPDAIARDWIQGDTILGFFTHDTDLADTEQPDTAQPDTARARLERIVAVGGTGPALSLYRMADEGSGSVAMNFMKASRIILFMEQGEVERVEAEGPIEGVHLDPTVGEGRGGEARAGVAQGPGRTAGRRGQRR